MQFSHNTRFWQPPQYHWLLWQTKTLDWLHIWCIFVSWLISNSSKKPINLRPPLNPGKLKTGHFKTRFGIWWIFLDTKMHVQTILVKHTSLCRGSTCASIFKSCKWGPCNRCKTNIQSHVERTFVETLPIVTSGAIPDRKARSSSPWIRLTGTP